MRIEDESFKKSELLKIFLDIWDHTGCSLQFQPNFFSSMVSRVVNEPNSSSFWLV